MTPTEDAERRRALGAFVRAQRERLSPEALGLPPGPRRRTPGLRREELAQLSGLSTTWVTWLEQGREISLSRAALSRLSRALQLGRAERTYLFELAARRDPERQDAEGAPLPAALPACVAAIACPAYILDPCWTVLHWNEAAAHLFAGWLDRDGADDIPGAGGRNMLRFIFLSPVARRLIQDHDARARRVVAEFRAEATPRMTDPSIRALVDGLRRDSPDFARLWAAQDVQGREGGLRRFCHPRDGALCFEQVSFTLASQPGLKLTMLLPQAGGAAPAPAAP